MAWLITRRHRAHAALPSRICKKVLRVILQTRHRSQTCEHRRLSVTFTDRGLRPKALQIRQRPSGIFCRQLYPKTRDRLQQNILCLAQPLPDRPISRLTEIPALGVLQMCLACRDGNPHIRNLRAEQNAAMRLFGEMRQNQSLPVTIQRILTDQRAKNQSAAPR